MMKLRGWHKALALAVAGLVLLAVFMLYTRPDFLLTLANELWACF